MGQLQSSYNEMKVVGKDQDVCCINLELNMIRVMKKHSSIIIRRKATFN